MTLAAALLVSVIGVLSRLTMTRNFLMIRHAPATWSFRVCEAIRRDFASARHIELSGRELRLVGFGGQSFETGAMEHDRSVIVYHVMDVRGQTYLVRRVQRLDEPLGRDVAVDLVCGGVASFDLQVFEPRTKRWSSVIWDERRVKRIAVPGICRLRLLGDREADPVPVVLECVIVTRAGE